MSGQLDGGTSVSNSRTDPLISCLPNPTRTYYLWLPHYYSRSCTGSQTNQRSRLGPMTHLRLYPCHKILVLVCCVSQPVPLNWFPMLIPYAPTERLGRLTDYQLILLFYSHSLSCPTATQRCVLLCAHVPMSPRVRTSVPDEWSTVKVPDEVWFR